MSVPLTDDKADIGEDLRPQPWMKYVLLSAAAYNILWGTVAILFPEAMFRLAGIDPLPSHPELWQCIGMFVAVFGLGYAIAARHPFVHWPIVLVGLLGKVLGPAGFLYSVYRGRLPIEFGWTILTNDLIWWVPFSVVLWHAVRFHQGRVEQFRIAAPTRKIDPLGRMMSQRGATLLELSRHQPLLVVFLRHSGCTFCREAVADISEQRERIEQQGTGIAFVHMGQAEPVQLLEKYHLTDLHSFRDPACSLYDAFGLRMGSLAELLGPIVWWRGFQSWLAGHNPGKTDGNILRMPGVFLLNDGEIVRAYRHRRSSDRPDYVQLATMPHSESGSEPNDAPVHVVG